MYAVCAQPVVLYRPARRHLLLLQNSEKAAGMLRDRKRIMASLASRSRQGACTGSAQASGPDAQWLTLHPPHPVAACSARLLATPPLLLRLPAVAGMAAPACSSSPRQPELSSFGLRSSSTQTNHPTAHPDAPSPVADKTLRRLDPASVSVSLTRAALLIGQAR